MGVGDAVRYIRRDPEPTVHRILLIQTRRLGDVVLSTALLDDLHRARPGVPIDWLVGRAAEPLLREHPLIAERFVAESRPIAALARELRARRYELVVDVQGSTTTMLLTRATGAATRVGWRARGWRLAYTRALPRGATHEYVVRERERLLELAGITPSGALPRLALTETERRDGERMLAGAGARDGARASSPVGLLLSTREAAKDWRAEAFAELAASLVTDGALPVVFSTAEDAERIARVRAAAPTALVLPPLELRAFLGALAACRVFVSGDTGPAHMADALGVPRVTIFGPTSPMQWKPPIATAIALRASETPTIRLRDRARAVRTGTDFTSPVSPRAVLDAVRALLRGGELDSAGRAASSVVGARRSPRTTES